MIVTGVASPRARVTAGDEHALFEIGSVTKAFTGVLLADLVLAGEVRLEDPLAAHLPAGAPLPRWEGAGPTLLDLITHHAGLPNVPTGFLRGELALAVGLPGARDPWRDADDQAFQRAVAATRVRGTGRFRYSSLGVGLLGRALEHRTGTKYETLLRERVLRPLELEETWVDVPAEARGRLLTGSTARGRPQPPLDDAIPAAGGLRSSAADVLRFLEATLDPPAEAPGPALALARTPQRRVGRGLEVAFGWLVQGALVWHNGGTYGFRSWAGVDLGRRRAAVALSSRARGVDRLGRALVTAD